MIFKMSVGWYVNWLNALSSTCKKSLGLNIGHCFKICIKMSPDLFVDEFIDVSSLIFSFSDIMLAGNTLSLPITYCLSQNSF